MSERFKAQYLHRHEWKKGVILEIPLTCHFKFEKATDDMKHNPFWADGDRPICNGCGPSGFGALVPDSILGLGIMICGDIHNWGYQFGKDREDKNVIDETFGDNMDRIIRAVYEKDVRSINANDALHFKGVRLWAVRSLYLRRINIAEDAYEKAVKVFGKSAFWDKRQVRVTLEQL